MIQVIAFREPTWFGPDGRITDFRLWDQMCRAYGVKLQLLESEWSEAEIPEEHIIVILDQVGEHSLCDFIHPKDCVYVFGKTHMNDLPSKIPCDFSVRIDTPFPKSMFGVSVCGAVLYDRELKECHLALH